MTRRILIAELQKAAVQLRADEAVAITQQLIECTSTDRDVRPPFGPPTLSNVSLAIDGSVCCPSCEATLAVSEAAIFLQHLLPVGTPRVPGSLRYTIARALLDVDAPPFDSIEDFSRALARHERGDRRLLVRGLLERASRAQADGRVPLSIVERRRAVPSTADLRRDLREADARMYDQQLALQALGAMTSTTPPPRSRPWSVVAAGIAVGVTLIGAGEVLPHVNTPRAGADPIDGRMLSTGAPPVTPAVTVPRVASSFAVEKTAEADPQRIERSRSTIEPTVRRVADEERPRARSKRRPPSLLERLHMQWLKSKVAIRADRL